MRDDETTEVSHPMLSASHMALPMATFNYLYDVYQKVKEFERETGLALGEAQNHLLAPSEDGKPDDLEIPDRSPTETLSSLGEEGYHVGDLRPSSDYARMRYDPPKRNEDDDKVPTSEE